MTPIEFELLPFSEQANYIWIAGEFISQRESALEIIRLYSLKGFFAELHYTIGKVEITSINTIENEQAIALYLPDIDLEELL